MATRVAGKDAMANGSAMVMFFFWAAVDAPPFFSRPCFILARKVCAKLCFCMLCLWMGSSTFHEIVAGKVCFYVFMFFENKPVDTLLGLIHVLRNLDLKLLMVSRARWSGVSAHERSTK